MSSSSEKVWLNLYPEISDQGSLTKAILAECKPLQSVDLAVGTMSIGWAYFELQDRFVQIACGISERVLITQLWHAGVHYAKAGPTEFKVACALVKAWLIERADLDGLGKNFGSIEISSGAYKFGAGKAVDYAWDQQLNGSNPEFVKAFQEAASRPVLRQLLPLTSHQTIRFSRVTGFPYTMDVPYIEALGHSDYVARRASPNMFTPGDILKRGTIFEAVAAILQILPADLAPARNGTANDWVIGS